MSAVACRPRGSVKTPSSGTPSRVAIRTSDTEASGGRGTDRSIIGQVHRALDRDAFSGEDTMLTHEENELITRISPGTPMGDTLRRYWIPALLAWELPGPDCPPVRVKLLGEDLVAFRDTDGRIGLLEELCPHRRASLFFGRNEECGLRCVYHGWKFDVSGRCVDMMNEPEELSFKHKIRQPSYPTVELGGLVWTYMGPPDREPPLPKFAWTQSPATHRHVSKVIEECNWLQALEGGIDTSHAPILHRLITTSSKRGGISPASAFVRGKAPKLVVDLTDWGYQYSGLRPTPRCTSAPITS